MVNKLIFSLGSFEAKMYTVTCLTAFALCFLASIFNSFLGIDFTFNLLSLFIGLFYVYFYYQAKKKGVTAFLLTFFLVISTFLFAVFWFVNGGLSGTMTAVFVLFLIQVLILTKVKYMVHTLIGIVVFFLVLVFLEISFPEWLFTFQSSAVRKVDVVITLTMVLFATSYFIFQIKKAYEKESVKLKEGMETYKKAKVESEKYMKLQSEFIANVSHEIRTPLNGIIGNAELLSELNKTAESADFVNNISRSGQLLLGMINNILDLSKIESDKLELSPRPFSLKELLSQVESVFKLEADQKGLALTFSVSNSLPDYLLGDQYRIKQIFINLIGNAIKFTDKGGVEVLLSGVKHRNKLNLKVSVKDTGIGVSKENTRHLFDRFFQVNQSLSKNHDGFGLGLIITKNLVQAMGGTIQVKSVVDKGSVFRFNLLLKIEKSAKKVLDKTEKEMSPSIHVLIAEDNEINAMLLEKQLDGFGMKSRTATNGLKVLEELKVNSYDIILMDVQMPELDGIQATEHIRANKNIKQQPVIIAITANANIDHRQMCIEAGMNDYLSKPTSSKDILAMLKKWSPK